MAFVRPILAQLVERVQEDFISRLDLDTPLLRRSLVLVLSRVVAGAAHMLHGHLEYLSKQIFPDQAERAYLLRWGALFGKALNPATYARGPVRLSGTDGRAIPAGTRLRRSDGAEYTVDVEQTISSGHATVAVTAVVSGIDGNCDAGTVLSLESPIVGVDTACAVYGGDLAEGTDQETTDEFRVRVLERMRAAPHGGNASDYVAWAKEVSGVTRAWCYPLELGAGTVVVRFVRDDDSGSIIPSAGEVATVQAHIAGTGGDDYLDGEAPVTAVVTVLAPVGTPLNFDLRISPSGTPERAAVTAALSALLTRIAKPGGTIPRSQIEVAIGTADGVTDFSVIAPSTDVVGATGEMATMGTITWE